MSMSVILTHAKMEQVSASMHKKTSIVDVHPTLLESRANRVRSYKHLSLHNVLLYNND